MANFIKASHDRATLTAQYIDANGRILLRTGGTISWRFNNPGNMRPRHKKNYPGQIGIGETASGSFAIFESYESGRQEKKLLLRRAYNTMSLQDAIYKYAPPNENDTEKYISFLVSRTGFSREVMLSSLDDAQIESLMDAMEIKEGYNAKTETREERWINTINVNVNNGSAPIADLEINIKKNNQTEIYKTDQYGNLPPIPYTKSGEKLELFSNANGVLETIGEILTVASSLSISLICNTIKVSAPLIPKNGSINNKDSQVPYFEYRVAHNDALSTIARRFRVSTEQLQQWNNLKNPNQIYAGQILIIGEKEKTAQTNTTENKHTVKSGENARLICKQYHITLDEFRTANPQIKDINKIYVGQQLLIKKNEKLAPQTPKNVSAKVTKTNPANTVRTGQGTGQGLVLLPVNQSEAPWMEIAFREFQQWYGKKEGEITKEDNYHQLIGKGWMKSLEGTENAWCASFVNYCLQEKNFKKSNEPLSALGFRRDTTNFVKIDLPIFGALATIVTKKGANLDATNGSGHVAFVYSLEETDGYFIMLGGNQSDGITAVRRKISSFRFYVPKAYYEFAKTQQLTQKMTVDEVYQMINQTSSVDSGETR